VDAIRERAWNPVRISKQCVITKPNADH
jgi:hypothetical protein